MQELIQRRERESNGLLFLMPKVSCHLFGQGRATFTGSLLHCCIFNASTWKAEISPSMNLVSTHESTWHRPFLFSHRPVVLIHIRPRGRDFGIKTYGHTFPFFQQGRLLYASDPVIAQWVVFPMLNYFLCFRVIWYFLYRGLLTVYCFCNLQFHHLLIISYLQY